MENKKEDRDRRREGVKVVGKVKEAAGIKRNKEQQEFRCYDCTVGYGYVIYKSLSYQ